MLKVLDRYVTEELWPPFAISVGVFTFFLIVDRVYQLTDLVITKQVPFALVSSLLAYTLPPLLSLTLPVSLLLAVLVACGRLSGDLEVVALKASGVSPLRLFRPFLAAGVVVSVLIAWLTLVVNPWASRAFQKQLFTILQTRATTAVQERTFIGAFGGIALYVEEVSASQVALKGILASDERDPELLRIIVAPEGQLLSDEAQRRLILRFLNGAVAESDVRNPGRFRYTAFSLYDMNLPTTTSPSAAGPGVKPEKEMQLGQLVASARAAGPALANTAPYRVELHKRFALPMAALVFATVGFPLGIRAQRGGRAVALALSSGVVVAYYILSTSLEGPALGGRLPAWLAIWLPNVLFGLLGLALLRAMTRGVPRALFAPARDWIARLSPLRRRQTARAATGRQARRLRGRHASTFIIDRYLLRQYLLFIGIGLLLAAVFSLVVDLLQSLDRFLRAKPAWTYIAQHFLYLLPRELYKGLPLVVLVSTVFLFLSLTRHRELDALKAAGVSLYRASLPILVMALLISLGALLFQETALPAITERGDEVDRVKIRGFPPRHLLRQGQIWYRSSDRRFLRIGLLDPVARSLDNLVVLDLGPDFRLVDRLDVRRAQWTPDGWQMSGGVVRRIDDANQFHSTTFDHRVDTMPEHIDDFLRIQKPPDTMSFRELYAHVTRLREGGHQVRAYLVPLHAKLSFPLVHLIMALVAIPFALVSPRSGGRSVGVGVAIVISVGYWFVHSAALALARADLLPPVLAAWTANIIFAGLGTALFFSART